MIVVASPNVPVRLQCVYGVDKRFGPKETERKKLEDNVIDEAFVDPLLGTFHGVPVPPGAERHWRWRAGSSSTSVHTHLKSGWFPFVMYSLSHTGTVAKEGPLRDTNYEYHPVTVRLQQKLLFEVTSSEMAGPADGMNPQSSRCRF